MGKAGDMIAGLRNLPGYTLPEGVAVKRAFVGDTEQILSFVKKNFPESETWPSEVHKALMQSPEKCFIATENKELLGFACYDATAKGFFGPTGVSSQARGKGVGKALLLRTLEAMREDGYGYAVIGWVTDAEQFYRKVLKAEYIPDSSPENSVYGNMISM